MVLDSLWDNPPNPFNPSFDPESKRRFERATILLDEEETKSGQEWSLERRGHRWGGIYKSLC